MGKKVGDTVNYRSGAGDAKGGPNYTPPSDRSTGSGEIVKVFQHGVRAKMEDGSKQYIHNNRITGVQSKD